MAASRLQIEALRRYPFYTAENGLSYFKPIPALDIGRFSLRRLANTVAASSGSHQFVAFFHGGGFLVNTEEPLSGSVNIELLHTKDRVKLLLKRLPGLRPLSGSITLQSVTDPTNSEPHVDRLNRIKVVSAWPGNTRHLRDGWEYQAAGFREVLRDPIGEDFKVLGELRPEVSATIKDEDWQSEEEHALAISMDGSVHKKDEAVTATLEHDARALLQLTLKPLDAVLTPEEAKMSLTLGLL